MRTVAVAALGALLAAAVGWALHRAVVHDDIMVGVAAGALYHTLWSTAAQEAFVNHTIAQVGQMPALRMAPASR